tara:strand:+ start:227 stop:439 length:213 start_codon:yes stop_codon:yes gene_type:complete
MATVKEKDFLHSLDKRTAILEEILVRLETNHLAHMQKDIDKLDFKIWGIIAGISIQLAATIIALINLYGG